MAAPLVNREREIQRLNSRICGYSDGCNVWFSSAVETTGAVDVFTWVGSVELQLRLLLSEIMSAVTGAKEGVENS
ncbi:hypothetical protein C5167_005928 [Papaver somniferum]|uniref:Uncharacterized protein n=1 Tax=Papaver somniferum TaxID=3469 RepID=A0A4Y7JBZ9_PAPSO|nr:hypothetical protein C5167_005928 [Papaver somniferum]